MSYQTLFSIFIFLSPIVFSLSNRGKLVRRSWQIDAVVGVDSWLRGSDSLGMDRGFNSATNQLEFGFNFASIFATIFAAIFATIARRSGRDRASIVVLVLRRSLADRLETNPGRSHDRISSIAARSRLDRAANVEFFHDCPPSSDGNPTLWRGPRIVIMGRDRDDRGPSDGDPGDRDGDRTHQKAPRITKIANDHGRSMKIG